MLVVAYLLDTALGIAGAYFAGAWAFKYGFNATWSLAGAKVYAGVAGGFTGGLIASGGNLKSALVGAATGGAAGYIGASFHGVVNKAVAHGAVGGTASVIQGGKFGVGFASSFFTKVISDPIQGLANDIATTSKAASAIFGGIMAALVGGTASVIGGNKFASGAQTAAMQYLFNQAASRSKDGGNNRIGFLAQAKGFVRGFFGWFSDVTRTTYTGLSTVCSGFSEACAKNVADSARIGSAIYEYRNDPEVQRQVEVANDLTTDIVMSNAAIQSQIAGRAAISVIALTTGPVGIGLNAMAITGGALNASDKGGNIVDMINGAIGIR